MDELDRILASEEGLEPSSGFTRRVMEALEQDQPSPPIPFPWVRLLPALLGALGVVVAFAFYVATGAPSPGSTPTLDVAKWLEHPLAVPLGWAALALIGSWVTVHLSMRLAAPTR